MRRKIKGVAVFNNYAEDYDQWFDDHNHIYHAEINALKKLVPNQGLGLEVGIGTGRFSHLLGIYLGVDPSRKMAIRAKMRGNSVCQAFGEYLPFNNGVFDYVALITVVCFVENISTLFFEVKRVLKKGGYIIIGFIDKNTPLGRVYESRKEMDKFYCAANFYSSKDIIDKVTESGFYSTRYFQTIFGIPEDEVGDIEIREGFGDGAFVAISAKK